MKLFPAIVSAAICCLPFGACSIDDRNVSAGEAFTREVMFSVQNTPQVTPLPEGVGSGPQVIDLTENPPPQLAQPGGDLNFAIAWEGGTIESVNVSFTLNQYFSIPVPLAGEQSSGVVQIPATVGAAVCDSLDDICHQIDCFIQVVDANGNVSVARARQLVLDCGGMGCNLAAGTAEPGDPCEETRECVPGSVCFNKYCVGDGVLRVSLGFSVDSDFDLHVQTPSGAEIYFAQREADGGELDVDQCISTCGTDPHAENVVFDGTALPGTYEVWVDNFDGRAAGDFTIEVAGDVSQTFTGTLPATSGAESERFTFTR